MEMIEKMMGMFGGFGMKDVQDKNQKEALDKFNKMCLEFALKLDGAVGIERSETILKIVVQVAKHSDSAICDNFLRMLRTHGEMYKNKNPSFLELFPVKSKVEFKEMDSQTKASIWAYFASLKKLAEAYKKTVDENPLEDLKNIKMDALFGDTLDDIREVLRKNNVDCKKMVKVVGEIFDTLPIDDLVSQVPTGALPKELGVNLDDLKQNAMKDQIMKLLSSLFVE